MKRVPSGLGGLSVVAEELMSMPHIVDGTGILLLTRQWQGIQPWARASLGGAFDEIEVITGLRAQHCCVNIVPPGGGSGKHVDPTPFIDGAFVRFVRWHLPLVTNPGCWFEEEGAPPFHMDQGCWYGPVEYWEPHAVGNDGTEPRMHLVVDLAGVVERQTRGS